MVGDARFSGRVDLFAGELLDKCPAFDSAGGADVQLLRGEEKLIQRVENVEVDDSCGEPAVLSGEIGDVARGVTVSVVGVAGVTVHIVVGALGGALRFSAAETFGKLLHRLPSDGCIGAVEFYFEGTDCVASDHLPVSPVIAVGRQFHVAIW
ncbi:MAG: hypothetical protein L6W00_29490 [Lentisphaeria bacterium]|nr:MAG: hypothetical protein L6W00_29490 [Lentisphaeria bacterium]